MSDNSRPTEIAGDIIVALISRNTSYLGTGSPKEIAEQVATAYDIVYQKVYEKWTNE